MRLWLDDVRDPRTRGLVGFVWVKSADEAIALLETGQVVFASLDHDLGLGPAQAAGGWIPRAEFAMIKTGYDVVCWMEQHNVWPRDGVIVHSMNPTGKKRIAGY